MLIGEEANKVFPEDIIGVVIIEMYDYADEKPEGKIFSEVEFDPNGNIHQHISSWVSDVLQVSQLIAARRSSLGSSLSLTVKFAPKVYITSRTSTTTTED